jgi:hypothetical protein
MIKRLSTLGILGVSLCSTGCSRAPSVAIIGSFFPVWMVCIVAGIVLAFVVRAQLLRHRLESQVGPLALFYPCLVTLFACLLWLLIFA